MKSYWRYWGKARREGEDGAPYHLLAYHCMDVAAVGKVYLENHPGLLENWAKHLETSESTLVDWLVFFLCLHDLGKFSRQFQGVRADICCELGNEQQQGNYAIRHDSLGNLLWLEEIESLALDQEWLFKIPHSRDLETWSQNLEIFARVVTGHHGQPPKTVEQYFLLNDHFSESDIEAATQFATDSAAHFLGGSVAPLPDGRAASKRLTPLSWWMAGFAVLCDWLGSNEKYFKYRPLPAEGDPIPFTDYWKKFALPQAREALKTLALFPRKVRPQTFETLFEYIEVPTPLQQTAAKLPMCSGPQLLILEDVTGAGKTEAALMLAYRLIQEGKADGFYFGLPTMATSNAMYRRIVDKKLDERFYLEKPNRVLAHSASRLEPVLEHLHSDKPGSDPNYRPEESSAGNDRDAWFADSRKKALLADIGVGTIDQALLAVLYTRHQSLRLFGLARKILIVDEVHACDAYMLGLLESLLKFHTAAGGSAILLSATLPKKIRLLLTSSFREGLGDRLPELPNVPSIPAEQVPYPLLTHIGANSAREIPLETRPEVARSVTIECAHSMETACAILLAARSEKRCACWIRNTVDDSIAAYEALRNAGVAEADLLLFHARFALGDRLQIENTALEMFGPESNSAVRAGKILICTQVLESSVDVDLDVMISDLAPVDLLIQRAGRLCRHVRDAAGNPSKSNGRGTPTLWLFSPEFSETPGSDWISRTLPGTAAVYPDHGRLWLTLSRLLEFGKIVMPGGARNLVEGVYGEDAEERIPKAFEKKSSKVEGDQCAKRSVAGANSVKLNDGYVDTGFDLWDDALTPTRLEDQPSVTLRLARWTDGELKSWISADRFAWELSQLSVRISLFADEAQPDDPVLRDAVERCRQGMPDKGRWSKLLVLEPDGDQWLGHGQNKNGERVGLRYDASLGLRRT